MSSASASSSPPGDEGSPHGDESSAICNSALYHVIIFIPLRIYRLRRITAIPLPAFSF
jgi:hypothetical protein